MPDKRLKGTILVVDDTPANINVLLDYLGDHGFKILVARDGKAAIKRARYAKPDLILLDVMMPGIDGFETCNKLKTDSETSHIPVIFMTALSELEDKVRGFGSGAVDYITKPFQHEEVLARVTTHITLQQLQKRLKEKNARLAREIDERKLAEKALQDVNEKLEERVHERTVALEKSNTALKQALAEVEALKNRLQAENTYLREEIRSEHNFADIIGKSPAIQKVLKRISQVASTDASVFITGETGTGKELIARAIHNLSPRKDRPLVKVNCGAIAANLVESELFGHERGAFTGAHEQRTGRFELADSGTIFLDEIAELPAETQVKLLRVLQEQEFERVGSSKAIRVNVRVITATNRDIQTAIHDGTFRADLYYRLNVFPIHVPPLRERQEDIPLLVSFFLHRLGKALGKKIEAVSPDSMQAILKYSWPGNIRELENVLERAAITAHSPIVHIDEIAAIGSRGEPALDALTTLQDMERTHILRALEASAGVIEGKRGAAATLGLHPNTLRSRMQKLGIRKQVS